MTLIGHLVSLPGPIATAIDREYRHVIDHALKQEWDDAQVDAGRFCEAVLRAMEWHIHGSYTPIDGKSKPNRKHVVAAAAQTAVLPASMRLQIPACIELMMDFRNSRNAAHLGSIDPSRIDGSCVVGLASWVMAELVRLETNDRPDQVQAIMNKLSERQLPMVEHVGDRPIVLDTSLTAAERALVLLYQHGKPIPSDTLMDWGEYQNATRWRIDVLRGLQRSKYVHVDERRDVHLLRPGLEAAQKLMLRATAVPS